jgi:hypothetical protein
MCHRSLSLATTASTLLFLYLILALPSIAAQATEKNILLKQFCLASQTGNLLKIKKHLKQDPTLANQQFSKYIKKNKFKGTALHYAVGPRSHPEKELLIFLIEQGCNPNSQNNKNDTPLHCALRYQQNLPIIKELVHSGTHLFYQNNFGDTPLHCAIYTGEISHIELLLAHGAPLDIHNKKNLTPYSQTINSQALNRRPHSATRIKDLIHNAQLFRDSNDKTLLVLTPITHDVSPAMQQFAFRALLATCEFESLKTIHTELSAKNPVFLNFLLKNACISLKQELSQSPKKYREALCTHWLKMPNRILPYISEGKLDEILEELKTTTPQTTVYRPLMVAMCERLKKLKLLREQKQLQLTDLNFYFR